MTLLKQSRNDFTEGSGLRLNLWKICMIRNLVVCVPCQNLQLKHCQQLNPSAPGKMKFVFPRSSGDVVVQWTGVDGLENNLYSICLLLSPTFVLSKIGKMNKKILELLVSKIWDGWKFTFSASEPLNICDFWPTAVSVFPKVHSAKEEMTSGNLILKKVPVVLQHRSKGSIV